MTQKEALKLALEYLKLQKLYGPAIAYGNTTIDEAIEAMKKVLVADFVAGITEQPEQEPVGKIVDCDFVGNSIAHFERHIPFGTLLYTTPPQRLWVGLTESDRRLMNFQWQDGNGTATEIIDLVEAKLKEKNGIAPQAKPAAQEGWKLVPIEPTADMRNAGNEALDALKTEAGMSLACKPYYAYRAMLAAAPQGSDNK